MELTWKAVHSLFPVNDHYIWLNNCGTTPASSNVLKSLNHFFEGYSEAGILTRAASYSAIKKSIKEKLSELINCKPSELCLIHNTSEGMNYISHGLNLSAGKKLILMEKEYPSNYYPWEHWKEKGVGIEFLPMADSYEGWLRHFKEILTADVSLVSLSPVHWCTGQVLPIEEIGALCHQAGVYFVVDGSQAVGSVTVDVKKSKIDFMAMAGWKWLLGPLGLGVLFVSEEKQERLSPIFKGTSSVEDAENYLPYKSRWKRDADRFELSTPNFNDWIYFESSLNLLWEIGFENVRKRLLELSAYLTKGLQKRGYRPVLHGLNSPASPIVSFDKDSGDMDSLSGFLTKNKIIHALRLNRIRFGPHVYLLKTQLDTVLDVIDQWDDINNSR